jgi:ParB-like chromosome segregation protein Spo0J
MLKDGQQVPIKVRPDGERFVLIEGLHRLEAARSLGDTTINGYRVDARKH